MTSNEDDKIVDEEEKKLQNELNRSLICVITFLSLLFTSVHRFNQSY